MRSPCHLVPLLSAVLGISGCYLAHGLEGEPGPVDAGPPSSPDSGGRPGPSRRDAGPVPMPDGGPALLCPLVRGNASCLSSYPVAAGFAFDLPVTFDRCVCCAPSECV